MRGAKRRCAWRAGLLLLVLATAAPAFAGEQRLVRVIWDVGHGDVYYKPEPLIAAGQGAFVVPGDAGMAKSEGFMSIARHSLHVNDVVRVFVVNYNPVSHVWDASSAAVQIARQPSVVPAILNAAVLALTGAAKLPETTPTTKMLPLTEGVAAACNFGAVEMKLTVLRTAAQQLYSRAADVTSRAKTVSLTRLATQLADVPSKLSAVFDDAKAWSAIVNDRSVFGANFEGETKPLADAIDAIAPEVEATNTAVLEFDNAILALPQQSGACADQAKKLAEARTNIAAFVKELTGTDSPLAAVLTTFDAALKLWKGYRQALQSTWDAEAIEIDVKDPLAEDSVVRVDAVFASPDKTVTAKVQRSLVLGMKPNMPVLVISAGVGFNGFDFKALNVVKTSVTQSDGTTAAKDQLTVQDDTSWNPIVPVWLENIRIAGANRVGFYGTFGTTPDRNIFKNAILGGSAYVPRWKTMFTLGVIFARGYGESELTAIIRQFSDDSGYALDGVTKDNLPLPAASWKHSLYGGVSFRLVSF